MKPRWGVVSLLAASVTVWCIGLIVALYGNLTLSNCLYGTAGALAVASAATGLATIPWPR